MAKRSLSLADDVEHPQPQEQQEQLQQMPRHYWPGRRYCAICEVYYPSDLKFDAHLLRDQHAKKLKRATDYEPEKIALFNDLMIRKELQREEEEEDARVAATFASGDGARTS